MRKSLQYEAAWTDPENMILREITQSQRNTHPTIPLMERPGVVRITEVKRSTVVARDHGERGRGKYVFKGQSFSFIR